MALVEPNPFKLPPPFDEIILPEYVSVTSCELKMSFDDVPRLSVEFVALRLGPINKKVAAAKKEEEQQQQPTKSVNRFDEIEYEEDQKE